MSDNQQRFERGVVITDVDHESGVLQAGMVGGPITFTRPDPTDFVLLVSRVGPGTGNVDPALAHKFGATAFKPVGTDYATEKDLLDAGYVAAGRISALRRRLALAYAVLEHPDASGADKEYQEALGHLKAIDEALANVSRETSGAGG